MHHADGALRENLAKSFVALLEVFVIHRFVFLDQGVDYINLTPATNLGAEKGVQLGLFGIVAVDGLDRLAAGR